MGRPSRLAWAILLGAGIVLVIAGAASIAVGILNPGLISSQLPPEAAVDAPAVGGAAVALGVATAFLGLVHGAMAVALRLGVRVAATGAVVLASTMAVLALGFAVAAVVSIASGSAPAIYMVPAAIGLGLGVIGYAIVTALVIRSRGEPI
ncbi:MAG TPA: hypothetical protein VFJ00_00325 [Candidatus Limnocylindria bacterium]|nr:hypothetical protein [Candidatus Limnocylindria bacterium]